jgi:DNA-binding HxlR family transcriptional regulator
MSQHLTHLRATQRALNLTPQAKKIVTHLIKAGDITARDAMADYGITSASLTRRFTEIEKEGIPISREQRVHPIHQRKYTNYSLTAFN